MNDYICREDVQDQIVKAAEKCQIKLFDKSVNVILQILQNMPAADVQPVKRGRWLPHKITASSKCSLCKRVFADETPYCPNCGARMKEDGDIE